MQHVTYVPDHIYLSYTTYKHVCAFKHNEKQLVYLTKMSVERWGGYNFSCKQKPTKSYSTFQKKKIIANK